MNLDDYRAQMDEIDEKLIRLLGERMDISCSIAEFKKKNDLPTADGGREQYKLYMVAEHTGNPLYKKHMQKVFEAIMEQSRALQDSLR